MAVPTGAYKVTYQFGVNPQEWSFRFTAELSGTGEQKAVTDTALEAGANAVIAHLESEYPTSTVSAGRIYEGTIAGDPWPAP